jgi:hypothetical protein
MYASTRHSRQGLCGTNPQHFTKVNIKSLTFLLPDSPANFLFTLNMLTCKAHTTMSESPLHLSFLRNTPSSFARHTECLIDSTTIKLSSAIAITALAWASLQDDMYLYVYLATSLGTMIRLAWRTIWMWRAWLGEREDENEEKRNSSKGREGLKQDEEMGLEKKVRL